MISSAKLISIEKHDNGFKYIPCLLDVAFTEQQQKSWASLRFISCPSLCSLACCLVSGLRQRQDFAEALAALHWSQRHHHLGDAGALLRVKGHQRDNHPRTAFEISFLFSILLRLRVSCGQRVVGAIWRSGHCLDVEMAFLKFSSVIKTEVLPLGKQTVSTVHTT